MKNFLKTAYLATVLGITLLVTFCNKPKLTDGHEPLTPEVNIFVRDEDDTIGVCTMPTRDSIRLNIPIVDGILTFADHDAMITALDDLFAHDIDDVIEWENRTGFKSLFSEHLRISGLPLSQMTTELTAGRLGEIMKINADTTISMQLYNPYISKILNIYGLVRVGNYVGTIGDGVTIWTDISNKTALIQALDSRQLPNNITNFFIFDDRYFGVESRGDDVLYLDQCPTLETATKRVEHRQVSNGDNRRINVFFQFFPLTTPASSNVDYTCKFIISSGSTKSKNNLYKTSHYWSYNFKTKNEDGSNPLQWSGQGSNDCKKFGGEEITLVSYRNVMKSFLATRKIRLVEVIPGSSGQSGTAASHRGMNGEYIRWQCD